jgi:SAM-dependent methyltransferase
MICKICNYDMIRPLHRVKEMMFGLKTAHDYYECPECESLQIAEVPGDLEKYYPDNYYSFKPQPEKNIDTTFLRKLKSSYLLYGKNKIAGFLLSIGYKIPEYTIWLKQAGVRYNDAILDAGSGSGDILAHYCKAGFTNLLGIDPFLKTEFISDNGKLRLLRKSLFDKLTYDQFDFVMLNHSFEHMDEPHKIFKRLSELVKPGKFLLVRIPLNKSYAAGKYGINWVDWDAPRHLILHSVKSMRILAQEHGFETKRIIYDSTAFQFWGSEQYSRGISLHDERSYAVNKANSVFSDTEINNWKKMAAELNEKGEGDQACFFLQRK